MVRAGRSRGRRKARAGGEAPDSAEAESPAGKGGGVRSPQIFSVLRLFRLFMYPRLSVVSGVGNCFFARKGLSASAKQDKTKQKRGTPGKNNLAWVL